MIFKQKSAYFLLEQTKWSVVSQLDTKHKGKDGKRIRFHNAQPYTENVCTGNQRDSGGDRQVGRKIR